MSKKYNFIREFTSLAEGTEVPEYFALWTGISGMSMALGRRVWLDMKTYTLRPNFYVVLVAGSGKCRKSTVINWLKKIIRMTRPEPEVIAQKITPEAMVEALQGEVTEAGGGTINFSSHAIMIMDELITFLNKRSYEQGLGELLIQLFDCEDKYVYHTRGRGKEEIFDCCGTLIGGATPHGIRTEMPPEIIGTGLASRIIFVYVDKPPPAVSRYLGPDRSPRYESLALALERARLMKGQFDLEPSAWLFYDDMYRQHRATSKLYDSRHLGGYASRWADHILKLAMILAASEETKIVKLIHLKSAKELIVGTERYLEKVISMITGTPEGSTKDNVLNIIAQEGRISRQALVKSTSHLMTSRELGEFLQTMIEGGEIELTPGPRPSYRYIPEVEKPGSESPGV